MSLSGHNENVNRFSAGRLSQGRRIRWSDWINDQEDLRQMSLLIVFYVAARRAIDAFSKSEPEPRRRIERDLLLSRSDIDRKIIGGRSAFSGASSRLAV